MKAWLEQIEKEYGIDILFACEAGSRSWGYASVHSDQDIRYIYRHQDTRKYFSLDSPLEVITMDSPYDAQGWDIKKAFHLLRKSNPSLFEWSNSTIIYLNKDDFQAKLQQLVKWGYSPFSLAMHYLNLARRILKGIEPNRFSAIEQKQLLYCLRSLLIIKELVQSRTISGLLIPKENRIKNFSDCTEYKIYLKLINAKKREQLIPEKDSKIAYKVIDQLIANYTVEVEALEKGKEMTTPLNEWLWDLLDLRGE